MPSIRISHSSFKWCNEANKSEDAWCLFGVRTMLDKCTARLGSPYPVVIELGRKT